MFAILIISINISIDLSIMTKTTLHSSLRWIILARDKYLLKKCWSEFLYFNEKSLSDAQKIRINQLSLILVDVTIVYRVFLPQSQFRFKPLNIIILRPDQNELLNLWSIIMIRFQHFLNFKKFDRAKSNLSCQTEPNLVS